MRSLDQPDETFKLPPNREESTGSSSEDDFDPELTSAPLSGNIQEVVAQFESSPTQAAGDRETVLFNQFLAGNDEAYRTLYDAYERPLYVYCSRLMANEIEAQDIFQDIWIKMYKLRGHQESIRKFSGLLFTVARNLCLNALRDKKQLRSVSLEETPSDAESLVYRGDHDRADLREMLQKALQQLPVSQREAFILREYSGYSYQEIAEITGATMINVKTRAWRARERLRKVMAAWLDLRSGEEI